MQLLHTYEKNFQTVLDVQKIVCTKNRTKNSLKKLTFTNWGMLIFSNYFLYDFLRTIEF